MTRSLLPILLLFGATASAQTTYYVAAAGGNDGNGGSLGAPWATLAHAVSSTSSGDTIFMQAGVHTIATPVNLPVGVNLTGGGNTSVVNCTSTEDWNWCLLLASGAVNTNGNQSVSHLRFTGNGVTAYGAIRVVARGNVSIHDCEFQDFDDNAVTFDGQVNNGADEPAVWTQNNSFYNNLVRNTCKENYGAWMSGGLQIGAQQGMRIYNNYFRENERGPGLCGYPIKYFARGYNRDLQIYSNTIVKLPAITDSNDWNFAIEFWNYRGAVEIYDNHIEGSIDIDHVTRGPYSYGLRVHDNYFGYDSLPTSSGNWSNLNAGLYIEFACDDIQIYGNEFHNLESAIRFSPRNELVTNVSIHYNLVHQIGNANHDNGVNVLNFAGEGFTVDNLRFENNTIFAGSNGAQYGIILPGDSFTNTFIRNNVFQGFVTNPIEVNGTNKNGLFIQNNIFHANGSNAPNVTGSPASYVNSGNLIVDPLFVNPGVDFHVRSNSPTVGAGLNVGLTTDYDGVAVGTPPEIGAFEYVPPATPTLSIRDVSTAEGNAGGTALTLRVELSAAAGSASSPRDPRGCDEAIVANASWNSSVAAIP